MVRLIQSTRFTRVRRDLRADENIDKECSWQDTGSCLLLRASTAGRATFRYASLCFAMFRLAEATGSHALQLNGSRSRVHSTNLRLLELLLKRRNLLAMLQGGRHHRLFFDRHGRLVLHPKRVLRRGTLYECIVQARLERGALFCRLQLELTQLLLRHLDCQAVRMCSHSP